MVCSLAEEKAGALSAEDFVPADTVAVSDIIEGEHGQVCSGDGDDHRQGAF